jgi:PBP1b-binding outer membrane lipoprotein LpoB
MKKKVISGILLGCTLFFSGCFNGDEVKCDNQQVISMVQDNISNQLILDLATYKLIKDQNKTVTPIEFMTMKLVATGMLMGALNQKEHSPKMDKFIQDLAKLYKSGKFMLKDIRTTSKDKELNKVTCSATAEFNVNDYTIEGEVNYLVQKTDDGKKLYVEVQSFKEQ